MNHSTLHHEYCEQEEGVLKTFFDIQHKPGRVIFYPTPLLDYAYLLYHTNDLIDFFRAFDRRNQDIEINFADYPDPEKIVVLSLYKAVYHREDFAHLTLYLSHLHPSIDKWLQQSLNGEALYTFEGCGEKTHNVESPV